VNEAGFVLPTGTVTLLLGDVEGSTRGWEADPKAMQAAIVELNEAVDELVGRFDGVRPVEQGEGDSFVAAFARARDGVACALEVQRALVGASVALRLGLHTGDVARRDEGNYVGPTIIRAARLRNLAHGGQTVVSEAVHELVADALPDGAGLRDLGVHRLKDLSRPEHVYQLCHPDLRDEFPPLRSLDARPNNLPVQRTSFIDREDELASLCELVGAGERLVTLTGSGGCGKTRLALHVAAELLDAFPDGVWVADLAAITDPSAVGAALLQVFALKEGPTMAPLDALVAYLGARHALVVLDNCEHVLDAAASLSDGLVSACTGVSVLATSRQPLGLEGEVLWRVPSLPCPAADRPAGIEGVSSSAAVQLFADRARRARPGFAVSERNADAVAEICRRLDGIPLAIELAAARVRVFTPTQIADALSERFRILTGAARTALPRQQTLEASVDWSYNLLTEVERSVFRRLAVFAGSFAFDAAEAVCAGPGVEPYQVLDQLTLLVDKSLVVAELDDEGEDARYRLLETVRAYAAAHLAASGEEPGARDRHRAHYLGVVEEAGRHLEGPAQDEWLPRLAMEYPNIRAALEWARPHPDLLARAATALTLFWASRGPNNEGQAWLEAALGSGLDGALRADLVFARAWLATIDWDIEGMMGWAGEALALADALRDGRLAVRCQLMLGMVNTLVGGPLDGMEAAIEAARQGGDHWMLTAGLTWLGAAYLAHDLARARTVLEEGMRVGRGTNRAYANASAGLSANTWTIQGDLLRARPLIDAAIAEAEGLHDRANLAGNFAYLATVLIELGETAEALAAVDRMETIGREGGIRLWDAMVPVFRGMIAVTDGDFDLAIELAEGALELAYIPMTKSQALLTLSLAKRGAGMAQEARAHATELAGSTDPGILAYHLTSALAVLASLDRAQGQLGRAEAAAHEALTAAERLRAGTRIIDAVEVLAWIAGDLGSFEEAARLAGAASAARDATGYGRDVLGRAEGIAALRAAMGAEAFDGAEAEGRSLTLDEAVAYARRGRGERKRPPTGWASLTPVEAAIVTLVREGMTNAEIGARLFVSPRTVQTHLTRVYTKLGVKGRTALAALPGEEGR
jgi:predicted ATPase/class 3 adenylate cyclase/DNA-binding CsgD family transcriptional regulator